MPGARFNTHSELCQQCVGGSNTSTCPLMHVYVTRSVFHVRRLRVRMSKREARTLSEHTKNIEYVNGNARIQFSI